MVPEYSSSWTQEIVQAFACACNPLGSGGGSGGSGGGSGGGREGGYYGFQVAALNEGFFGV